MIDDIVVRLGACGLAELPEALFRKRQLKELVLSSNSILVRLLFGIAAHRCKGQAGLQAGLQKHRCAARRKAFHACKVGFTSGFHFSQALPPAIDHLRQLRTIRLDNNQLKTLPPELGLLVHLQLLDASHNEISTLPLQLGGCIQLQFLNLLDNPLTVSGLMDCTSPNTV
jgi:Leucine-rich repeat (LRR) protein